MRKFFYTLMLFFPLISFCENAKELMDKAENFERKLEFTQAIEAFKDAHKGFLTEKNDKNAQLCLDKIHLIQVILQEFPYSEAEAKDLIKVKFPKASIKDLNLYLAAPSSLTLNIDGKKRYFREFTKNIQFQNPLVAKSDPSFIDSLMPYYTHVKKLALSPNPTESFLPYIDPKEHVFSQVLHIPRDQIPELGHMKIWFPLPQLSLKQQDINLSLISPKKFTKFPFKIDSEISLAYFDIPLNELKEDLHIEIQAKCTRYGQNFIIDTDPKALGSYNIRTDFHKQFTRSFLNTNLSPAIREKAKQILQGEKNPFVIARKFYDHIVQNTKFGHVSHTTLFAIEDPESVFFEREQFGDALTQSIYFSALCRTHGIPARTICGYVSFGQKKLPHFWAEFYLPNYGWIPVDTSSAQMISYLDIPDTEKKALQDFFFAHQDPFRIEVQVDVDQFPFPLGTFMQRPLPNMTEPYIECEGMGQNPFDLIKTYWKRDISGENSSKED